MRVTPPILMTDAKLTSSTVAEPFLPAAYNAGTAYAFGDIVSVAADFTNYESLAGPNTGHTPNSSPTWWRIVGPTEQVYSGATTYALAETVISTVTHRVYESVQAANTGKPLPVPPETLTAWWLDVGPTNRWAMFDLKSNTQTVCPSPLTVVVTPGARVNTCGRTGIVANSAVISETSASIGGTVYGPATINLNSREVFDWYSYFFEPFSTRPSHVVFDLPPYTDAVLTATLTATSGNVKCGGMTVGTFVDLGKVQWHAKADSLNFSKITRDDWGNATLVPIPGVPKTNQTLELDKARVNKVMETKALLDAAPALWTGLDDSTDDWFEMVQIVGIWKQFSIDMAYPSKALVTLELEQI